MVFGYTITLRSWTPIRSKISNFELSYLSSQSQLSDVSVNMDSQAPIDIVLSPLLIWIWNLFGGLLLLDLQKSDKAWCQMYLVPYFSFSILKLFVSKIFLSISNVWTIIVFTRLLLSTKLYITVHCVQVWGAFGLHCPWP